jgi:nucleotide-binding universal stress UspA family protein
MNHIVLTTDLSPESERAFAPTIELARKLGMKVTLLAVLEDLPFEPTAGGLVGAAPDREALRRDWEQELQRRAAALGGEICTRAIVREAVDVAASICEFANREKAAFIAIASHGRSGLRRLLLGSVAEVVLRHARVPVLVFPPPE